MTQNRRRSRASLLHWLSEGLHAEPDAGRIFVQLCERLIDAGIDLSRATLHFRVHHPQWLGTRLVWTRGQEDAFVQKVAYDVEATDVFQRSPFRVVIATGREVRQKIQICGPHVFPVYDELRQQGHTDYAAWPLDHTQGRRHLITFATDRPGGFENRDIAFIRQILPLFSLVTEIRLKSQLARTLLRTYVGSHASEQILEGATTRGSGATLSAAIMICDLRNFTELSGRRHRDYVIGVLNEYFDMIAEPIEAFGGEILKFIGDGLLAIFPLTEPDACRRLLDAVCAAYDATARRTPPAHPIRFGTGVHVGEVMYGNIGSKRRLDFTVIGPAVNLASRLEGLTNDLKRPVLVSGDFVTAAGCSAKTDCLGLHSIKGFDDALEVHALRL
ncbi:adenylate/guanylate cyclase domain-containing protein [Sinorhizobium medicae]|uniref:adenylate/guanylate cyclase domain-containing protein n=2 Tax=Sinorhizobium medicae TaxID=110321 RepID=UPI00041ED9AE|nr:adenylate/guanylate cyclase domain-containing protein [Sinorhizobium medicae]MBO1944818.1 adenylate/guanylate cyclase domain-containing protein [Sinorhizobium medicae]MDX0436432.1 adenylate/guanylate cyclase domain-containing protein [Sinorhizobium medicae]MDX0445432.1 adenylate/guanylate cyclase domain-containing protein [Sinorhizobium medicae]MDX0463547.1 adenylate/guanylate cyclase domain-containing protein [Sinorhizobium medicae]MDX0488031.1 adenylate/guanylate cyclase domain-containing